MITRSPVWFQSNEHNSLAYWIIFYLEVSLHVHYQCYVLGRFRNNEGNLPNKQLFLKKDGQYINIRNEIKTPWFSLLSDSMIKQIGNEVFVKSLKLHAMRGEMSTLNSGLLHEALYSENRIMEVLLNHQEPAKFIQELCML